MANRNDPDVRQHETLPGLCPTPGASLTLPGGVRPVEQMVDAAIERIAHEQQLLRLHDLDPELNPELEHSAGQQPTRLRWKGLDVSEEFRSYAERVARGEDLPPFAGRVLAEPSVEFPWGSLARSASGAGLDRPRHDRPRHGGQLALWASAAVVMGLLAWSVALKVHAIDPPNALLEVAAPALTVKDAVTSDAVTSAARARVVRSKAVAPSGHVDAVGGQPVEGRPVEGQPVAPVSPSPARDVAAAVTPAAGAEPTAATASSSPQPALAVSVAPPAPEPLADPAQMLAGQAMGGQALVGQASAAPLAAAPVAAASPAPAAPKPAPSARTADLVDFGIDELPLPSSSGAKTAGAEPGNVGDLARIAPPGGTGVRKEPGSESSAKGLLLVENPSF